MMLDASFIDLVLQENILPANHYYDKLMKDIKSLKIALD